MLIIFLCYVLAAGLITAGACFLCAGGKPEISEEEAREDRELVEHIRRATDDHG